MHPLPAAAEDDLGVRVVITRNHRNSAAGSGLHDADCSASIFIGNRQKDLQHSDVQEW